MATALGVYATIGPAKERLGITDASADALLQSLCNQWNGWLENKTGRILGPIAGFASTVAAGGGVGSSAVTLASAVGVTVGDALMFGPVAGTHEHQIVAAPPAGNVVTLQSPLTATYANGTAVSRVLILSGSSSPDGRTLPIDVGISAIGALEVSPTENAISSQWYVVPPTDYWLAPLSSIERDPGAPASEIRLTALPSASNNFPFFSQYENNVRISGATLGWQAAPDEIVGVALRLVVADYRRRGSGGGSQVTIGSDGQRVIEQALSATDWHTINRYCEKTVDII